MGFLSDIAGSVVGGLFGMKGQSDANKANAANAALDRDFQREVLQNRQQWQADDFEKAGFNRILTVGTPSTATGSNASIPAQNALDPLARGINSAMDQRLKSRELRQALDLQRSQIEDYKASALQRASDTELAKETSRRQKVEADRLEKLTPWLVKEVQANIANSSKVADSQVIANIAGANQSSSAAENYRESTRGLKRDNDALEKLGSGGKVLNDVGERFLGKKGAQYARAFISNFSLKNPDFNDRDY